MGENVLAQLEAEYCPPLDPALLSAIVSDYDLNDANSVNDARSTLDHLKESAFLEAQADFDPSGTGSLDEDANVVQRKARSCTGTSESTSRESDMTSVSNGLSYLDLESGPEDVTLNMSENEDLEGLDEAMKLQLLKDVFGKNVSKYDIEYTLRKCDGRWNSAMEELLNHVYFGEAIPSKDLANREAVNFKSIDAFAEDSMSPRGRRVKAKNKRLSNIDDKRSSSLPSMSSEVSSPVATPNKWMSASDDIHFIASRIGVSRATVSSTYYGQGASLPRTISALLKNCMEESKYVVTDDATVSAHMQELGREFPTIAQDYLSALVRLTHPSTTAAHELATALTSKARDGKAGGVQIITRFAPLDIEASSDSSAVSKKQKDNQSDPVSDTSFTASDRETYVLARAAAFSQAAAAHRKAKSDRLMGGVAAYYSQLGRDYSALAASASAAAADDLAASQSSSTSLDLHGVDVLNGVRIARERVGGWWDQLGESRVNGRIGAENRSSGYSIIVGMGRHSEGGKSKLGPAVTKMLRQEGWRVENNGAVLIVMGRVK